MQGHSLLDSQKVLFKYFVDRAIWGVIPEKKCIFQLLARQQNRIKLYNIETTMI